MGLFDKKRKEKIPEVAPPSFTSRPSYSSSTAPSYQSATPPPPSQQQRYAHSAQPPYQQQPQQYGSNRMNQNQPTYGDKARDQLFAGAPTQRPSSNPYGDNNSSYRGPPEDDQNGGGYGGSQQQEEDDEVEGIKQQMRFVKQESLASTRNAVRIALEAEETARATLDKLGEQSDRIANTERHLDLASAHNERAIDETKELEALNRSIFRPNFNMNKSAKRDKEERRLLARHASEQAERESLRAHQFESRQRIDNTFKQMDRSVEDQYRSAKNANAKGVQRGRYQFESTESDDEVEDEIEGNLEQIGGIAERLKMLAMSAGQEVDAQNSKLGTLNTKTEALDARIYKSTNRLGRIH